MATTSGQTARACSVMPGSRQRKSYTRVSVGRMIRSHLGQPNPTTSFSPFRTHRSAFDPRDDVVLRFSRLYTSSAVIAETVAHIQRNHLLDQQNLHDLTDDFLQPQKWISLLAVDDDVLVQALRKVKERNDRRFSLVDATNIELMQKHQIDFIFGFDALYDGVPVTRGYSTRFLQRVPQ